jgi:hypothetical protein
LRQAYDYWQDQPGYYLFLPPWTNMGGVIEILWVLPRQSSHSAQPQFLFYQKSESHSYSHPVNSLQTFNDPLSWVLPNHRTNISIEKWTLNIYTQVQDFNNHLLWWKLMLKAHLTINLSQHSFKLVFNPLLFQVVTHTNPPR